MLQQERVAAFTSSVQRATRMRVGNHAMFLTIANVLVNVLYYAFTLVLLPWLVLFVEDHVGLQRKPLAGLRVLAVPVAMAGVALQVWCVVAFQRIGRGTPSPLLPPRRLVVEGPYRWARNPMNTGELLLLAALAGWYGSPGLLAYTLMAALAFHGFIVLWEEPRLVRRFGSDYLRYRTTTRRWLPGLR
jgi:protein-S-isoprenylcysteine O-methyltransferase Ste14